MLTESQVERSFRNLFNSPDFPTDALDKADKLIDELRPESPLRLRLSGELEELRKVRIAAEA